MCWKRRCVAHAYPVSSTSRRACARSRSTTTADACDARRCWTVSAPARRRCQPWRMSWCPNNIEFIRRINGLESAEDVRRIVFDASYLVMGLGDVYLGAPVATPLDPRHRLVTTKYNPARTWTPENAVGIGGAYLCVYGMEGPGGYQFVGRTLQMWNTFHQSPPWLLRFFDQIRFYEVSAQELLEIREDFPHGGYPLRIEEIDFRLRDYHAFLDSTKDSADRF